MAEQFGMAPWDFWQQCSGEWWHRINAYNAEIARYQESKHGS